jgi:hypothetical protein
MENGTRLREAKRAFMIDLHTHLWPHEPGTRLPTYDELARTCERAAGLGVQQVAITEHCNHTQTSTRALGAESTPVPRRLMATTRKVYPRPRVRPVITPRRALALNARDGCSTAPRYGMTR